MRRALLLCLCLGLLCSCAAGETEAAVSVYFISGADSGPAIVAEHLSAEADMDEGALLRALLGGPRLEGHRSPFPPDLTLRGWERQGEVVLVDFSEQYGSLADVSLTLADYCVALTLCQLDGVEAVEISVSGQPLRYRSHQRLTAEEALLALPVVQEQGP